MEGQDVALAVLVAAAAGLALATRAFFRRARAAAKPGCGRLVVGNLLVFATLLSVVALAAECWFRWGFDSTDSFGMLRTTDRWFARHYRFNRIGFRDDREYDDLGPVADAKKRVDFIGDSFTAGHGVADVNRRFANLVRAARPGWQVHVFATNGKDTSNELTFFKWEVDAVAGGRYVCGTVVLVYCLNDIADITPAAQDMIGRVTELRERGVLARTSHVADYLRFLWIVKTEPDLADYFGSLSSAYAGPAWDEQRGRLRELRSAVAAHGGRLVVVTFPFLQDLGPGYAFRDVHRKLAEFWKAERVPALDLLDVFDGKDADDLVVGRFDAHPNEKAHAMAAEAMLPFLDRFADE